MMPYVITIAQQKGGAGKSTLAAHLSVALVKLGMKVALIDTDPQHTLKFWHNIRDENKLGKENLLEFISASGWRVGNDIARLSMIDIVIIDSPPHMETETKSAIRAANIVIIPCQPSPNDLWASKATLEIVKKEEKKAILVLNRCSYHSKLLKHITEAFPNDLDKYFIGNRVAFAAAMLSGLTVIETSPNSIAANEIFLIAQDIIKLFQKEKK
jgi:chromosome partitioning protein